MATLREVIGNRVILDAILREQEAQKYDALSQEQQRAAYIHQVRIVHEIGYILQLVKEGKAKFKNNRALLDYIEALAYSTDGGDS